MTQSRRTSRVTTAILLLALASCKPPVAVDAAVPTQPIPKCNLGGELPAVEPRRVAGYPARAYLAPYQRAEREHQLEQRAHGWKFTLAEDGLIQSAEIQKSGVSTSTELRAKLVKELFVKLADAYGLPAKTQVTKVENVVVVSRGADADPLTFSLSWADGNPGGLLRLTTPREIRLPAIRELTDDEMFARWGVNRMSFDREMMVRRSTLGEPCDPVEPGDCAGRGPRVEVFCAPVSQVRLVRATVERPEVTRRVVGLRIDCQGFGDCYIESRLPSCSDAFTGEVLTPSVCDHLE